MSHLPGSFVVCSCLLPGRRKKEAIIENVLPGGYYERWGRGREGLKSRGGREYGGVDGDDMALFLRRGERRLGQVLGGLGGATPLSHSVDHAQNTTPGKEKSHKLPRPQMSFYLPSQAQGKRQRQGRQAGKCVRERSQTEPLWIKSKHAHRGVLCLLSFRGFQQSQVQAVRTEIEAKNSHLQAGGIVSCLFAEGIEGRSGM